MEVEEIVGVPNTHGIGLVRKMMKLSRRPRPARIKMFLGALPTKKPKPPTSKGTKLHQIVLPSDDKTIAWDWDGKQWLLLTRAEGEKKLKAQAAQPKATVNPFADVGGGSSTTAKPAAKVPAKPPTAPGKFVGQTFLPANAAEHAWLWDGKVWRGIARSDALKPQATVDKLGIQTNVATNAKVAAATKPPGLLDKIVAAVTPNVASGATLPKAPAANQPAKAPSQPGRFAGEIFLPSNKAEHAWRWDGQVWRGISRSDAVKPTTAAVTAAAKAASVEANKSVLEKFTDSLKTAATAVGLTKPVLLPHPSVPVITDPFSDVTGGSSTTAPTHPSVPGTQVPPVSVPSTAGPVRLPTKLDPDGDGQVAPGVPAPRPTVGKPGTFPSTARDPNGDGIEDATGRPAPVPTLGVPGTFPSTPLDPNGDGIIDSTGQNAPPPLMGQKGSFPSTPDDADGDGLNDITGKPLNANGVDAGGFGSMALPIVGMIAAVTLMGSNPKGRKHL